MALVTSDCDTARPLGSGMALITSDFVCFGRRALSTSCAGAPLPMSCCLLHPHLALARLVGRRGEEGCQERRKTGSIGDEETSGEEEEKTRIREHEKNGRGEEEKSRG